MRCDPRYFQISMLSLLLVYGLIALDFSMPIATAMIILLTAQITQWTCTRLIQLPKFDPRSALISSLSLCLLLRTDSLALAVLIAILAISSKFFIRINNKHVFNPTNFALVIGISCFDQVWVSSGQWGQEVWLLFLIAGLGLLVVTRSRRSDITFAFLFFYTLMVFGRALWLGDPISIPLHQLQSGALLIFAFFMISDPMTSPNSRIGRILSALFICLIAGYIQFVLFRQYGVLYALVIGCLCTPVIDRLIPAEKFNWTHPTDGKQRHPNSTPERKNSMQLKGENHAQPSISIS